MCTFPTPSWDLTQYRHVPYRIPAEFIQWVFRPPGNMYYMDANIVKPLTMPLKLSYAELVGPQDAMWFVSHWWGCLVLNLRVSRFLEEIPELPIIPSWMYFMFFWADVKLQSLSISGWVHSVPFCPRSFLNRNKFEHKSYCGFADKPSLGCGSEMLWGTEFRVYCEALSRHAKAWGILGFRWPGMRGRCGDSHDGRCMQL